MSLFTIHAGVDARFGEEALRLSAQGTSQAVVEWSDPREGDDDRFPARIARGLARGLAACGSVALRADEAIAGAAWYPPPVVDGAKRIASRLTRALGMIAPIRSGVAITSDPAAIAPMFDHPGWSCGDRIALAFEAGANPEPIARAVMLTDDWRSPLPLGARVLLGAGHDGDFAVVSAVSAEWLARFFAKLPEPA